MDMGRANFLCSFGASASVNRPIYHARARARGQKERKNGNKEKPVHAGASCEILRARARLLKI